MSKAENVWFFITLTAGFALGAVGYALVTSDPPKDRFFYEFQGLIAGLLALLAGILTVSQMARVDLKAAERHADLMRLNLRADELKVDRFANGIMRELGTASMGLSKAYRHLLELGDTHNNGHVIATRLQEVRERVHAVRNLTSQAEFLEAKALWGAEMVRTYREWDSELLNTSEMARRIALGPPSDVRLRFLGERDGLDSMYDTFHQSLVAFEAASEKFAAIYKN